MSQVLRQISYEQAKQLRDLDLPVCGTDTTANGDFDRDSSEWETYVVARCKGTGPIGDEPRQWLRYFALVDEE